MKKLCSTLLVTGTVLLTLSCASIIHGTRQDVGVSSTPSGAVIYVDGNQAGQTPAAVSLKRKHNHTIRLELEGYEPFEMTLTHKVSGWVWGNLVFGMLPGLIIDAVSGGLYKLTPEQVQTVLQTRKADLNHGEKEGMLFITVTMHKPEGARPIAHLTRAR